MLEKAIINSVSEIKIHVDEEPDVGLALRKLRVMNGYSQQFVANNLHISRNAYIEWERNKVKLTLNNCLKICDLYGIKLSQFIITYVER